MLKTTSRTIGLSNDSIEFLESQKILNKKNCWNIKNINLYKDKNSKSFLNFESKKSSFYMASYNNFYKTLETSLKKNKLIKIKKKQNQKSFFGVQKKDYEIIIISDKDNFYLKIF